jgi:hypothetical protein
MVTDNPHARRTVQAFQEEVLQVISYQGDAFQEGGRR